MGLLAAVFPGWVFAAANLFGFEKPVNFLFFACVAFLMVTTLLSGVAASREADKNRALVQEVALISNRLKKAEAALALSPEDSRDGLAAERDIPESSNAAPHGDSTVLQAENADAHADSSDKSFIS